MKYLFIAATAFYVLTSIGNAAVAQNRRTEARIFTECAALYSAFNDDEETAKKFAVYSSIMARGTGESTDELGKLYSRYYNTWERGFRTRSNEKYRLFAARSSMCMEVYQENQFLFKSLGASLIN